MAAKDESTLTDRQREALHMFRDGLSIREVADALDLSYGGAGDHQRRLRKAGFLPKKRGRNSRRQTRTTVTRSADGRGSRASVGTIMVEGVPSLTKAVEEMDAKLTHNTEEMRRLNEQQHELAEDSARIARMKEAVEEAAKVTA